MVRRVAPPRPPALGAALERGGVRGQPEGPRATADAEVAGGEGVRVAQRAQGDVVGGPRADAWDGEQGGAVAEIELARREGAAERAQRPPPRIRHPDALERGGRDR